MPALSNPLHEKFCHLIVESGDSVSQAYGKLSSAKNPSSAGGALMTRPDVMTRIAELREEINTRSVATLSRKREVLRQMIEGIIPTKIVQKANGGVEETFDKLAAMHMDSKLAGELADNINLTGGADLKLNFTVRDRNSKEIDGSDVMDAIMIPDASDIVHDDVPALKNHEQYIDAGT